MLIIQPLLNSTILSPDDFQRLQSLKMGSLIRCCSSLSEEGSIDFPHETLRKAMETFGQKCPGIYRAVEAGDFLWVGDGEETRYFRIMPCGFQEWHQQGSLLVLTLPKPPTVKTFGYCTEMTLNSMLLDKSIEFYISSLYAGEEISQTHLGTLALENSVGCLKIWNNDSLLRMTIGVLLSAKEFPKPCWV